MREVVVLSHKRTVGSGKALADALGGRCITPKNTKPVPPDALLINYGVSTPLPFVSRHPVERTLNTSVPVGKAVHKLTCLTLLENKGVPVPEFTTDPWSTDYWFTNGAAAKRKVFARSLMTGSQGRGITIFEDHDALIQAHEVRPFKLFTRNVPKTKEYRVHVMDGKAIHVAQKRAMSADKRAELGFGGVDRSVRSYKNGWVFANELQGAPSAIERMADAAVQACGVLGLSFGAVDMLVTGQGDAIIGWAVCEVNTAPSLDGTTTLTAYVNAIKEIAHEN